MQLDGIEFVMAEVHVEHAVLVQASTQCYGLTDQRLAHAQLVSSEADAPAVDDTTHDVVRPVFNVEQPAGHRAWAGRVAAGGGLHPDGLVRALEVVDVAPAAEVPLSVFQILEAPPQQHFGAHRAVEALVLAVGLRMQRTAVAQAHAQADRSEEHTSE